MTAIGFDVAEGFGGLDEVFATHGASRARCRRGRCPAGSRSTSSSTARAARYSWTWRLSDEDLRRAVAEMRPWAEHRWGRLDAPIDAEFLIEWRAYDLS